MAISLKLVAPPTDEEIRELSRRNPGLQFERSTAGELVVTPTSGRGGRRELIVGSQLDHWAEADGGGFAFGPSTGFRLPDGSLLSPDASWVRRDRWEALSPEQQDSFVPLCPDVVFEVASPSDTLPGLRKKIRAYLANGCRLVVLIDPRRRAVEIYAPDGAPQVVEPARSVSFDPLLPGFTLDLKRLFE